MPSPARKAAYVPLSREGIYVGGAIDDRVKRSRGARAWVDVTTKARSRSLKWPFDCSVCISAELSASLARIPFGEIGRITVCDRLQEVLTRAASALERLRQERCMKRGEDWPPEQRLGIRFAARVPTHSEGPRFRHLCLVIDPGTRRAPILKIGEADQLNDILRPALPRHWALHRGRRVADTASRGSSTRGTRALSAHPRASRSPTHPSSTVVEAHFEAARNSLPYGASRNQPR